MIINENTKQRNWQLTQLSENKRTLLLSLMTRLVHIACPFRQKNTHLYYYHQYLILTRLCCQGGYPPTLSWIPVFVFYTSLSIWFLLTLRFFHPTLRSCKTKLFLWQRQYLKSKTTTFKNFFNFKKLRQFFILRKYSCR